MYTLNLADFLFCYLTVWIKHVLLLFLVCIKVEILNGIYFLETETND